MEIVEGGWYHDLQEEWITLRQSPEVALLAVVPITAVAPEGGVLHPEETERKDKFMFPRDQQAYALGRFLVRWLLSPDEVVPFSIRDKGKPYLPGKAEFNLSHGAGYLAVLFSRKGEVGVDIEALAKMKKHENLHDMVCHPHERAWIRMQGRVGGQAAFLKCWTRKEAFLKATGQGILEDLTAIDTMLDQSTATPHPPGGLRLQDVGLPYDGVNCSIALPEGIEDVSLACLPAAN